MQFSEMVTEVRRRLDESSATPVEDVEVSLFWTETDIKAALNEGYDELSDATEWYEVSDTLNMVTDIGYYNIAGLFAYEPLRITGVYNNQTSRWLHNASVRDLDERTYAQWQSTSGEPQYWVTRGLWQMGVFPIPSAAASNLDMYLTSLPAALTDDADTPDFPIEYHYALVEYALYDLLVQDGELEEAMIHWERFLQYAHRLRLYVNNRTSDRVRGHHG